MSKLQDGLGRGNEAAVDDHGRLLVFSVAEAEDKHVNRHTGKVWSLPFTVVPAAAGDYFFYLENTGSENYFITDVRIDAATAEVVDFDVVSGIAVGGTTIPPINRNIGKNINPSATIESGVDITGLTDEGELFFLTCEANKLAHLRTSSNIIVTPGSAIALKAGVGGIALKGMVSLVGVDAG